MWHICGQGKILQLRENTLLKQFYEMQYIPYFILFHTEICMNIFQIRIRNNFSTNIGNIFDDFVKLALFLKPKSPWHLSYGKLFNIST
jgi:hypothetical protein